MPLLDRLSEHYGGDMHLETLTSWIGCSITYSQRTTCAKYHDCQRNYCNAFLKTSDYIDLNSAFNPLAAEAIQSIDARHPIANEYKTVTCDYSNNELT